MSDALVAKAKEAVKTASRCWGMCAGATPDGYCLCEVSARAAIAVALEEAAKVCDEAEKRERQAAKEPCDMEELAAFQRGAFMSRINAAAIRAMIGNQEGSEG